MLGLIRPPPTLSPSNPAQTAIDTRDALSRGRRTLGGVCNEAGFDDPMFAEGAVGSGGSIDLYRSVQESPNLYRNRPLPT